MPFHQKCHFTNGWIPAMGGFLPWGSHGEPSPPTPQEIREFLVEGVELTVKVPKPSFLGSDGPPAINQLPKNQLSYGICHLLGESIAMNHT